MSAKKTEKAKYALSPVKASDKKKMDKKEYVDRALELIFYDYNSNKHINSILDVIIAMKQEYKDNPNLRVPCRDSSYKYFRSLFPEESKNKNILYEDLLSCAKEKFLYIGLRRLAAYNYYSFAPDLEMPIGTLFVDDNMVDAVYKYLNDNFPDDCIATTFRGHNCVLIIFQSGKEKGFKEAVERYNDEIPLFDPKRI